MNFQKCAIAAAVVPMIIEVVSPAYILNFYRRIDSQIHGSHRRELAGIFDLYGGEDSEIWRGWVNHLEPTPARHQVGS